MREESFAEDESSPMDECSQPLSSESVRQNKKAWQGLLRQGEHSAYPCIFNAVLLLALALTFDGVMIQIQFLWAHIIIWVAMLLEITFSTSRFDSSSGAFVRESEVSSLEGPRGLLAALKREQTWIVGTSLTVVTAWSAWVCGMDPWDEEKFWWAIASYLMYLVHALVAKDFFVCLLRSDLQHRGTTGPQRMLAPLLHAPPLIWVKARCSHAKGTGGNRIRRTTEVVTHRAKEWIPYNAWCDATEFPENEIQNSRDPIFMQVCMRTAETPELEDRIERFQRCHKKDKRQTYSHGLLVARLDSEAQWVGLCCTQKKLAVKYFLASLLLNAVPWRLAFISRSARLNVVILKKVVFDVESPSGFNEAPRLPKPTGRQGRNLSQGLLPHATQWAFAESTSSIKTEDGTALPSLYLFDFCARWLHKSPISVGVSCCFLFLVEGVLSAVSAQSRGWKLAAILIAVPLAILQGMHTASFLRRDVACCQGRFHMSAILVGFLVFSMIIVMVINAFWLSVHWEASQHPGPTHVWELMGVFEEKSWAVYLSDGFVDQTNFQSAHIMCKRKQRPPFPCNFIFAAPIYRNAAAANSSAPVAWAVSTGSPPQNVHCMPRGGLCGFPAVRIFPREKLRAFLDLIQFHGDGGPPMLWVTDPERSMANQPQAFFIALTVLFLVSPVSVFAFHCCRRRINSARESLAHSGTDELRFMDLLEAERDDEYDDEDDDDVDDDVE